mgnify:CR=1 FL=1
MFTYQMEMQIERRRLLFQPKHNEFLSKLVEVHSQQICKSKFYFKFSEKNSDEWRLTSLVYERSFEDRQDVQILYSQFKEVLKDYVDLIRLCIDEPYLKVGQIDFTGPEGQKMAFLVGGRVTGAVADCGGPRSLRKTLDLIKEVINRTGEDNALHISEFVRRYNSTFYIRDAVLRLITLSSLVEYIEKVLDIEKDRSTFRKHRDYEWINATRDLVSHGVVTYKKTVKPLNMKLNGTDDSTNKNYTKEFYFSRLEHSLLVKEAIDVYTSLIGKYIRDLVI